MRLFAAATLLLSALEAGCIAQAIGIAGRYETSGRNTASESGKTYPVAERPARLGEPTEPPRLPPPARLGPSGNYTGCYPVAEHLRWHYPCRDGRFGGTYPPGKWTPDRYPHR